MKRKLLVAVDGTKSSLRTALYAAQACSGSGTEGKIVLFHVLSRLPPHVESSRAVVAEQRAELFGEKARLKAERMLTRIKEQVVRAGVAPQSVSVEIVEEGGDVPAQIIEAAAEYRCDTIVVGRHEKSWVDKLLTGGDVGEKLKRKRAGYNIWVVD
jgi:nucleotide-binding universal stress UspA family protein